MLKGADESGCASDFGGIVRGLLRLVHRSYTGALLAVRHGWKSRPLWWLSGGGPYLLKVSVLRSRAGAGSHFGGLVCVAKPPRPVMLPRTIKPAPGSWVREQERVRPDPTDRRGLAPFDGYPSMSMMARPAIIVIRVMGSLPRLIGEPGKLGRRAACISDG